jgi:formate/nitrite transporter FocA (FNT family)
LPVSEPDPPPRAGADGADAPARLSRAEKREVASRRAGSSRIVHEVVRAEGRQELVRPWRSLMFSGLAAGIGINASILAKGYLHAALPDEPWRPLIESFGYTFGFIIVIMARMQLFTESTVTAVLPVVAHPSFAGLGRLLRLWGIVLAANFAGTLAVSYLINQQLIVSAADRAAILELSRELFENAPMTTLWLGIPSGFLLGAIAWILPNARESEIRVILVLTYLISLGHLSHCVAGSTEAWMMWLSGEAGLGTTLGTVILPSLVGNIIGGTGLFAVLAHGQVSDELQ